jgi:hypothetical protein
VYNKGFHSGASVLDYRPGTPGAGLRFLILVFIILCKLPQLGDDRFPQSRLQFIFEQLFLPFPSI